MPPLPTLGQRIAILGPSNSGKSTLAVSIAQKTSLPNVHLDQLRHIPNTNWKERSDEEFKCLHDSAILHESWVMEGNYSSLLARRLDRATGVILLNSNVWFRYGRYVRRTLRNTRSRAGQLEGGQDRLSWKMTYWIIKTRNKAERYARIIRQTGKPSVECHTSKELDDLYRHWDLALP
ncbi:MAG: AAA family ATPase [Pseudomonadota bacterium]